jgi:NTE family protein
VGSANLFVTEFFQPMEPSGRFFVAPSLTKLKDSDDKLFIDGQEIAIKNKFTFGEFDLGVLFGNSGQIRVGYRRGEHEISPALTDGPPRESDIGAGRLRATWDSLDAVNFPGAGNYTNFDVLVSRESIGADQDFDRISVDFNQAGTIGRYSLIGTLRYGDSLGSDLPFYATIPLGGFFNLSGLRTQELRGETMGFSRLLVYRQFGDVGNILGGAFYLGLSLETGNVWTRLEDPSLSDLRAAGAVFAGVDSMLGPLYVGWGLTDGGNRSFYLFLGRVFGLGVRRF